MRVKLNQYWMDFVAGLPESGIGYQHVDVYFGPEKILRDVMVLNSEFIELPAVLASAKITEIRIHKD